MENIKKLKIQNIKMPAIKARNRKHLRSLVNTVVTKYTKIQITKI